MDDKEKKAYIALIICGVVYVISQTVVAIAAVLGRVGV